MKNLFFFVSRCVAMAIAVTSSWAQPDSLWSRTYGGAGTDFGYAVVAIEDGGYVLAATTNSVGAGDYDLWLIKTDGVGDSLWCHTFGGSQAEYVGNAGHTADGGYFITGFTWSFGAGNIDYWMVKTDANGDSLWSRTYGGPQMDQLYWGQQTFDGGFILAGYTSSFGSGGRDFWLVKTDANGDSLWSKTFGGLLHDGCTYVIQTADSGYALCGIARSFGDSEGDFWLVKTDANGDSLWSRTFGNPWEDMPWCVRQTADGGYVITGRTARSGGNTDLWLVKTNAEGDSLWSLTYGNVIEGEAGVSVIQNGDGGYTIAGQSDSTDGDFLLLRTDVHGGVLWHRTFGGPTWDEAYDIQPTPDGGYIIAGLTESFGAGGQDVWLVKTGPDPLSAGERPAIHPASYTLSAFPNPFNPATTIAFDLPRAGDISLRVFDLLGREVAVLKDGMMEAGTHQVAFDGSGLGTGIYFARLEAGKSSQTKKLMLLK